MLAGAGRHDGKVDQLSLGLRLSSSSEGSCHVAQPRAGVLEDGPRTPDLLLFKPRSLWASVNVGSEIFLHF